MKRTFIVLLISILFISCTKKVHVDELQKNDGIIQLKGEPFSGIGFITFPNGKMLSETSFKDGIIDGKCYSYFENGQTKEEGEFDSGLKDGDFNTFYIDGEQESEKHFSKDFMFSFKFDF